MNLVRLTIVAILLSSFYTANSSQVHEWKYSVLERKTLVVEKQSSWTVEDEINARTKLGSQLLQSEIAEIASADAEKIGRNWSDGSAFIWNGTNLPKNPDVFEKFLRTAYALKEDRAQQNLDDYIFQNESAPVLSDGTKIRRIILLSTVVPSYEEQKFRKWGASHGATDQSAPLNDYAGFIVLEAAQSRFLPSTTRKFCSLPFVGQDFENRKFLISGIPITDDKSFVEYISSDGKNLPEGLEISLDSKISSVHFASELNSICHWKEDSAEVWKSSVQTPRNFIANSGVYRFHGLIVKDPYYDSSHQVVSVIDQLANLRRGLEYDCPLSENKKWVLIGSMNAESSALKGGMFYLERKPNIANIQMVGVTESDLQVDRDFRNSTFSFYFLTRPENKSVKSLVKVSNQQNFTQWLSEEIRRVTP